MYNLYLKAAEASETMSLLDPYSEAKIVDPGRGKDCNHLQVSTSFLNLNTRCVGN